MQCAIIYKQDCIRYALKREVAAFDAGFSVEYVRFLNRAKEYFDVMVKDYVALCASNILSVIRADYILPYSDAFVNQTRITYKSESGFFMLREETPGTVFGKQKAPPANYHKEAMTMAVKEKIRIRIKGYDHQLVDQSAEKIVQTAKRTGARVSGPVPLPTEKQIITILRAVHKYKDSREQFEMRTHKRLIDILKPSNKTVESLMGLELPSGVDIEIKL